MAEPTDEELVERLAHGDRFALAELIRRWESAVYQVAWRIVGNAVDAEEVRQIVFVRLLERPHRLPEPARFAAWLRRCTVNAAVTAVRRRKNRPVPGVASDRHDAAAPPEAIAAQVEEAARLSRALATFTAQERAVLSLRFDQDLSFAQIGDALGRPATTVKSQYARLIGRLRSLLAEPSVPLKSSEEGDRHV